MGLPVGKDWEVGGGSLDTSTSGDGSCLGCQEDVLTLLYVRSEPSMPKVQVGGGGMSKENMPRGSPLVPTLVAHTRPRDQLAS